MRLKHIEIENFKGIGKPQAIDLKPITLLFGPNSAGKSTILQALHYFREILERHNADPDQTIAGGLIDLGGFATLVHNHDLALPIRLKVSIDLVDEQGSERLPLNSGGSLKDTDFANLPIRYIAGENTELKEYAVVQEVGVAVEVRWSDLIQGPYVAVLSVEIDGQPFAAIKSPAQEGRAQLTDFNFAHPLLREIVDPNDIIEPLEDDAGGLTPEEISELEEDPFSSPLPHEIWELSRELSKETDNQTSEFRIAVGTHIGSVPDLDRELHLDLRDPEPKKFELEGNTPRVRGLRKLLDELLLGPVRMVRDVLNEMTYIGPLREIPSRSFRPRLSPDETRWAQGLAAWDLLYTDTSGNLLAEVNGWLSGEERLKTGYRLEKRGFKEVPVPSLFHQLFERGVTEDDIGDLQELYSTLKSRTEIALHDIERGVIVAPSDVGVGISQMIPVVVACLHRNDRLLVIEQPELHVHPAIQVGIGDLFIRNLMGHFTSSHGSGLLVETHSEHIILRLLRRIREMHENALPPGVAGLEPDDLAVIYVEQTDDGVRFRNIRVDSRGEFVDRWPKGFFGERAEELF